MSENLPQNLGLDLVRVTEAAAVAAGRWMGLGKLVDADRAATEAMLNALNKINIDGRIVIGEETKLGLHSPLDSGQHVGTGDGPSVDVVVDPIDGRKLLAKGQKGAISVIGVAPRSTMWSPGPAAYMEKLVVDSDVAEALVEECLHAPAAWTLALIARIKHKAIRDLIVFVLDRPRHYDLIEEIRQAGAKVMLAPEGDISGAIEAATVQSHIDVLMGIGGVAEGVIAACAVKSLEGAMLGQLAPQGPDERAALQAVGLLNQRPILTCNDLVASKEIFFVATAITDSSILSGVRYRGNKARTNSMILRCETGTQRLIQANHLINETH